MTPPQKCNDLVVWNSTDEATAPCMHCMACSHICKCGSCITPNPQSQNLEVRGLRLKQTIISEGGFPPRQGEVAKIIDPGLLIVCFSFYCACIGLACLLWCFLVEVLTYIFIYTYYIILYYITLYIYAYTHIRIYAYMHIHMYTCTHIHIYTYTPIPIPTHTCIYSLYLPMCVIIHTDTDTDTDTDTHR